MILDFDKATKIAKSVNKTLKEWELPISVQPKFIVMVSLVVREIRREAKAQRTNKQT